MIKNENNLGLASQTLNTIIDKTHYKNIVICISHSDYRTAIGGTEKVIRNECFLLNHKNISYYQFFPISDDSSISLLADNNQLVGLNIDKEYIGVFTTTELGIIFKVLEKAGVISLLGCHVHHLKGMSIHAIADFLKNVDLQNNIFFIHDFYSVCPQHNLLQSNISFCGVRDIDTQCITMCTIGKKRKEHAKEFNKLFKEINMQFVTPSEAAKKIWIKAYPEYCQNIKVIPHQIIEFRNDGFGALEKKPKNKKIRIAYLGYEAENKGWKIWQKFVNLQKDAPFEFFHFGASGTKITNVKNIPVDLDERGQNDIIEKIKEFNIDIAFLWSICPETYSFTLFEAFAGGCFIVTTNNSGNLAVQVQKMKCGIVFSSENDMLTFFENVNELEKQVSNYKDTFQPIDLKNNTKLIDSYRSFTAFQSYIDFPKEKMNEIEDLTLIAIQTEILKIRPIIYLVNQLKESQNYIKYLQDKHNEKDEFIKVFFPIIKLSNRHKKLSNLFIRLYSRIDKFYCNSMRK